jgi:hypothetical protein
VSPTQHLIFGKELEALLEQARASGIRGLALQERLRRALGADRGRLVYEQLELRERAQGKLPEPERWWLTRRGLEQASDPRVAAARAEHLRRVAGPEGWWLDATAGLGVESLCLSRAGLRVASLERDPELARALAHNLESLNCPAGRVLVGDALRPPLRPDWWFFDPDRRAGGQRSLDPAAWSPPLAAALEAARGTRGAAFKLAPACEPERLPPPAGDHAWVWVSLAGELKELALYTGELARGIGQGSAPGRREAWALDAGGLWRWSHGAPGSRELEALAPAELSELGLLAEPDASLVRSGLLGAFGRGLGLRAIGPGIGWLTGAAEQLAAGGPWLERWRVLGSAPADPRAVRALLGEHGIGPLSVRARGVGAPAEELAARFAGRGAARGTLFVARTNAGRRAFLVERFEDRSAQAT